MFETFTTSQVATLTGLTLRKLQWGAECGYVNPRMLPGSGAAGIIRAWDETETLAALILAALDQHGLLLRNRKAALRKVRTIPLEKLRAREKVYLLTDGKTASVLYSEKDVLKAFKNARVGLSLVDVKELIGRLNA